MDAEQATRAEAFAAERAAEATAKMKQALEKCGKLTQADIDKLTEEVGGVLRKDIQTVLTEGGQKVSVVKCSLCGNGEEAHNGADKGGDQQAL